MTHVKAGWLFLITILAEFGVVGLILLFPAIADDFMLAEVMLFAIMIIPFFIFMFATKTKFSDFFGFHKIKFSTILWTILYVILITPMSNFLNAITALIFGNVAENMLTSTVTEYPFIIMFLVVAIIGPLCEEMMFRGVFYRNFRKSGRLISSVIVSAIIFGLYHRNLNQFFYTAYVGVMFALIDEASDSIWPSVIAHMLFNGYSVCLVYFLQTGQNFAMSDLNLSEETLQMVEDASVAIGYTIVAAIGIIFIFLARLVARAIAKSEGNAALIDRKVRKDQWRKGNKRILSIPLIIGIVIAAASTVWSSIELFLENIR